MITNIELWSKPLLEATSAPLNFKALAKPYHQEVEKLLASLDNFLDELKEIVEAEGSRFDADNDDESIDAQVVYVNDREVTLDIEGGRIIDRSGVLKPFAEVSGLWRKFLKARDGLNREGEKFAKKFTADIEKNLQPKKLDSEFEISKGLFVWQMRFEDGTQMDIQYTATARWQSGQVHIRSRTATGRIKPIDLFSVRNWSDLQV